MITAGWISWVSLLADQVCPRTLYPAVLPSAPPVAQAVDDAFFWGVDCCLE